VRELLAEGRLAAAKRLLGRPYSVTGKIVRGHGVGSKLTVPTLNLGPESGLPPRMGVYVTRTREMASGKCWPSVSNVGVRPTFNGAEPGIETHLLAPAGDLPANELEIEFLRRLRDERRFSSPELLRRQIIQDVAKAEEFFRRLEAFREQFPKLKR
jgi:riboflavin kinase/FMN adenylyltransferase